MLLKEQSEIRDYIRRYKLYIRAVLCVIMAKKIPRTIWVHKSKY